MIQKTMLLITALNDGHETFKMIPISKDCAFVEAFYEPDTKILAVFNPTKINIPQMFYKVDDNGDFELRKHRKEGENPFKKQRILAEIFQKSFIIKDNEIEEFIKMFALNHNEFDFKKFLDAPSTDPKLQAVGSKFKVEHVDTEGKVMTPEAGSAAIENMAKEEGLKVVHTNSEQPAKAPEAATAKKKE